MNVQVGDCPWNPDTRRRVLGIQAQMPAALDETDSNLVFLIDISGSMEDANKLGLFKKTLPLLVEQLGQGDRVSIVVYASGTGVVLEGAAGNDKARIMGAVDDLKAGGSTNGGAGLVLAYQCAEQNFIEGGNNRIIMVSDGDLNVGITSASDLERYVSAKRQTGIYLTVLGFGTGNYKDNKMETIADKGNGNYHYIDRYEEAEKVFVEDLTSNLFTVADDVKLQLEFNPAYIKGYRQIGYENRALSDADFADDSKDAAEMGAGDQVIVVYEIVMADSALEVGGASLKYQENLPAGVENGEWLTLSLRYKEPGQPVSKGLQYAVTSDAYTDEPDKDWVYVSSVVEFYLVATASDYAGSATLDEAIARAEVSSGNDFRREEFVQLARMLD
jgi:Ca-activated chloride channel family protein